MKELTREVVTKETYGYEAVDGSFFKSKEECEKYEESAEIVVYKEAAQYRIGAGNHEDFLPYGLDNEFEIFDVKDANALHKINMYIQIKCPHSNGCIVQDNFIGEELILLWNYDHDYCEWGTLESFIDQMTAGYKIAISGRK